MSQSAKTVAINPLVAKLFGVPEIVIENLGSKGAIEVKRNAEKSIRVNFSNWRLDKGGFRLGWHYWMKDKAIINMKVPNASNQAADHSCSKQFIKNNFNPFVSISTLYW